MATPNEKIKFKTSAQSRTMTLGMTSSEKRFDSEKYVEGYAAKYDRYLLYDFGEDGKVYERFAPGCFDETEMQDVILQYDHEGRVYARMSNGTLIVEADDVGLFIAADLSKTDGARALYDDIDAKMITKMSWRFRVGSYFVEREEGSRNVTIVHTKIKRIYDVSAVSIPANENTEINARSWCDGVIAEAARSEEELENKRRKLRTKLKLAEVQK